MMQPTIADIREVSGAAREQMLPELAALYAEAFSRPGSVWGETWTVESATAQLRSCFDGGIFLVSCDRGQVTGLAFGCPALKSHLQTDLKECPKLDPLSFYFADLCVKDGFEGAGLARQLCNAFFGLVERAGYSDLISVTSPSLKATNRLAETFGMTDVLRTEVTMGGATNPAVVYRKIFRPA